MVDNPSPRERNRYSGLLLHPTSLPGRTGIGDIGLSGRRFIEFLDQADQSLWQVCPLGPTGFGDSPYACFSAFAGNPLLIGFEPLVADGLLDPDWEADYPGFSPEVVEYGPVIQEKNKVLARVGRQFMDRADAEIKAEFEAFCEENADWLYDFALFMALKDKHGGKVWSEWDDPYRRRDEMALKEARKELADEIQSLSVTQFLFFRQWEDLREYAGRFDIQIIGDVPIFVAYDSADVWSRPELFYLDEAGNPTVVAGVPPDYFSATGQRWGNPLYRWPAMADDGYRWWIERIRQALGLFDIIRLDHFRGFDAYWEVPAEEKTAKNGRWVRGPGADLFRAIADELGELPFIAEDLGLITPRVDALREEFGFPGMKVLQFAFGGDAHNLYLPHRHKENSVVYTGTHDNNTTLGWYNEIDEKTQDHVRRYLWSDGANIHLDLTRCAWMSHARYAIVPLQDILGLGAEARLNKPGAEQGNWQWRVREERLNSVQAASLRYLTELYGRGPVPSKTGEDREDDEPPDPDRAVVRED